MLTTLLSSCAVVMKSGNLNFLEHCGPLQACNGTALSLPFYIQVWKYSFILIFNEYADIKPNPVDISTTNDSSLSLAWRYLWSSRLFTELSNFLSYLTQSIWRVRQWWIGNVPTVAVRTYMKTLSLHLTKKTKEDHDRRPWRVSNSIPPEYEAKPIMR